MASCVRASRKTLSTLMLAALVGALMAAAPCSGAADTTLSLKLHDIFDEYHEEMLRESPTYATYLGDSRFNDRLDDLSLEATRHRRAQRTEFVRRLEAIDPATLGDSDRVSLAVLLYDLRARQRGERLLGDHDLEMPYFLNPFPLTQMDGPQLWIPLIARSTRFASVRDYEDYLKRLAAIPRFAEQETVRLQAAIDTGWMPPAIVLRNVPSQFESLASADPAVNPMYLPFHAFPSEVTEVERARLRTAGEQLLRDAVAPAFSKLRDFVQARYLPAGRAEIAASTLPGGADFYAAALQYNSTTTLSAREIHELGKSEVARIESEMRAVQQRVGFAGSREEFIKYLWSDPKFFLATPAEMLMIYRDIAKRADAQMPRLFRELPREPYGIRAMAKEEGDNTEQYIDGASDGSWAGYFEANTNNLRRVARWQMVDTLLHEAVPGHHMQGARAREIRNLPAFRRDIWFPAYGEGWAVYAETLGDAIGMYDDPLDKYGQLSAEVWRAARLVIDTGMHALGWRRDQAIEYMTGHTNLSRDQIVAEVDRYIVWPGQATAYKIGQLRIAGLRDKARAALGVRFDLRAFHNAVIDGGAVPLDVLDQEISHWIAAQQD